MRYDCLAALGRMGIAQDDAAALRRISMTLHRWHELECGDGNAHGSWAIVRGRKDSKGRFVHDDDGRPYLEHHHYRHGAGEDTVSHALLPDRERGALKRLARIMDRYAPLSFYVQGDSRHVLSSAWQVCRNCIPRGAALYVLRPGDVPAGEDPSCYYSRGIAVYR